MGNCDAAILGPEPDLMGPQLYWDEAASAFPQLPGLLKLCMSASVQHRFCLDMFQGLTQLTYLRMHSRNFKCLDNLQDIGSLSSLTSMMQQFPLW